MKVIIKRIKNCHDCPYFTDTRMSYWEYCEKTFEYVCYHEGRDDGYGVGLTTDELMSGCPLLDYEGLKDE